MQHFKTLSAYLDYLELPGPEHPMFSVFSAIGDGFLPCPKESSPPIINDCTDFHRSKTSFAMG